MLWATQHDAPPHASVDAIRQHNNVVVAATTAEMTPIPLRFGQWVSDEATAGSMLMTSHEKWVARLQLFRGAAEYGIRIFEPGREASAPDAPDAPDAADAAAKAGGSGTAYMNALARRVGGEKRAAEAAQAVLQDATAGIVLAERSDPLRTPHGVLTVAHLLHRRDEDVYRAALDQARARLPGLRLLSSGPWPPYSFVT
jgi:hypothetical protein